MILLWSIFLLLLPIDAMSSSEYDVVSDQGAAAEAIAVGEDSHLILELATGG